MPEEMYLVSADLMSCFNSIGRLQKLRADITRDLRILEREAQRLLAESPSNAQIQVSDEIKELEKLWKRRCPLNLR
jgi:hypothetical protein